MADNTELNAGSGGDTIATDDIGGVKFQRVKLSCGADGSATDVPVGGGVEAAALRVTVASDSTGVVSVDDNGAALTVDGTVTAELSAVDNAVLDAMAASLAIIDGVVFGAGTEASAQRVTIATDSTGVLSVDDNGGSLTVDGTVTANLAAGTNNIGDVDVLSIAAGDNNIGNVDIVSGTVTTVTTLTGGGLAHDSADSGNPVKTGGRAISANPTAMTANDRSDHFSDLIGYQLVRPYSLNQLTWQDTVGPIVDTTAVELKAAGAANVRNYITSLLVTNSDATVGTNVIVQDGNGGTTMWEGWAAPAGGGFSCSFPTPLRGTAATAVFVDLGTTSAEVRVSACGFQAID